MNPQVWVSEYGDYLFRFVLLRVSDSDQAKDLVQETFIAALKSKDNFKGDSSVKTWLTSICKHKILDHYRKSKREIPLSQLNSSDSDEATFTDNLFLKNGHWKTGINSFNNNAEKKLESQYFQIAIKKCLQNLSPKYREVFIAREIDEISTDDLCKDLSISSSNLWVMLHRARLKMQQCLGHILQE